MKTRTSALVGVALLLGSFSGCHHMTYATLPGDLVAEGQLPYREVGSFEIEVNEVYWLWGFAKGSDEATARAIVEKVREMGGNGVRDLHYKVQWTFWDLCVSCVGGIISRVTQTVFITGTVVQITGNSASNITTLDQLEAVADGTRELELPVRYQ